MKQRFLHKTKKLQKLEKQRNIWKNIKLIRSQITLINSSDSLSYAQY